MQLAPPQVENSLKAGQARVMPLVARRRQHLMALFVDVVSVAPFQHMPVACYEASRQCRRHTDNEDSKRNQKKNC